MDRRIAVLFLALLLLASAWAGTPNRSLANALPGRLLIGGDGIDLFDPSTGKVRHVLERGMEPAFYPSGRAFVYIRGGGCHPIRPKSNGCYTEYSVFERSLDKVDPKASGRRVFGWAEFFVRAVDVAPGGRLIFSAKPGPGPGKNARGLEIYSSSRSGGEVRRLTHNRVFENDPAVSPDGRHIAFARRVHGRSQIFSMRIDGSHVTQLTHGGRRNRLPSWSPDGRRLLFISQSASGLGKREVYSVGASGRQLRRLTHNRIREHSPSFAPNGSSIAFLSGGDLWLMGADGTRPRRALSGNIDTGYEEGLDWELP
jgi:Tol biopolymer transport system component